MGIIKRIFCIHDYEIISALKNNKETIRIKLYKCKKCNKLKTKIKTSRLTI